MGNMALDQKRGSDKLMAAWQSRALNDDSIREITAALEKSKAIVEGAAVYGGANPSGMRVTLRYEGDDVPTCGNDILFWLKWHIHHGSGGVKPPKILINGIPIPDIARVQLDFGQVGEQAPGGVTDVGANFGALR
jgi:hypothetical protein